MILDLTFDLFLNLKNLEKNGFHTKKAATIGDGMEIKIS